MRIPEAVQTTKSRCGQWLVDGCITVYPRIAFSNRTGELGEFLWEGWIDKASMVRTTAVVNQTNDWTDAEFSQTPQSLIRPRPVCLLHSIRCRSFPQYWVAYGTYTQFSKQVEVIEA